jgi:hypothetical protein
LAETQKSPQLMRGPLGSDEMRGVLLTLFLVALACASPRDTVQGRAEVLSWSPESRVLRFCESKLEYQLGIFTSSADGIGAREVERWLAAQPGPILVEVVGFPSTLPSGWRPATGVTGVLSVGHIEPVARGDCS